MQTCMFLCLLVKSLHESTKRLHVFSPFSAHLFPHYIKWSQFILMCGSSQTCNLFCFLIVVKAVENNVVIVGDCH